MQVKALLVVSLAATTYGFFNKRPKPSNAPPNIIILMADDLGWNDVSFHGSPQIPTPNLNALGGDGIVLKNYYAMHLCTPSRSAFLTGYYPYHIGMQHYVIEGDAPWGLPLNLTILPQHLKSLGYKTHAVGKWHVGFWLKEYTPLFRGFDTHFGYWSSHQAYYDHIMHNYPDPAWGLDMRRNMNVDIEAYGNYSTKMYAEEAVKIIKNHDKSSPLFLYTAFAAPHYSSFFQPMEAPTEYIDRFGYINETRRRIFAAMVSALDDSVGQIVQTLYDANMLANSIIVFSSDNGGGYPQEWIGSSSNLPLRGAKFTLWEGGVRVSALVWSTLFSKPGRVFNGLMHVCDWLPTLYTAAGGDVRNLGSIDGMNLWDALVRDEPSPRQEVLINIDPLDQNAALRVGDYKIIVGYQYENESLNGWLGPPTTGVPPARLWDSAYTTERTLRKLRRKPLSSASITKMAEVVCSPPPSNAENGCFPTKMPCLFNLKKDPCEHHNLANDLPKMLQGMMEKLIAYNASSAPPRNQPIDPRANPKYYNYVWVNWGNYV